MANKTKFKFLFDNYFKYILLNGKILSKLEEILQITFWNNIYKFCESDKPQIEILININRICASKDIKRYILSNDMGIEANLIQSGSSI